MEEGKIHHEQKLLQTAETEAGRVERLKKKEPLLLLHCKNKTWGVFYYPFSQLSKKIPILTALAFASTHIARKRKAETAQQVIWFESLLFCQIKATGMIMGPWDKTHTQSIYSTPGSTSLISRNLSSITCEIEVMTLTHFKTGI